MLAGISHHIYQETVKHHVFVCATDAVSNVLGLFLCRYTLQKRAVMSAMLMLSALTCHVLAVVESLEDDEGKGVVSALAQICSFLITGSWNILWLLSVEVVGTRARQGGSTRYRPDEVQRTLIIALSGA